MCCRLSVWKFNTVMKICVDGNQRKKSKVHRGRGERRKEADEGKKCSSGNHRLKELDGWVEARKRGGIMRITDQGVDHKSLWIDQRSQQHSLEGCQ